MLEHHRQFGAHFLQLAWVSHLQGAVDVFFCADFLVVHGNAPGTGLFEEVDAAKKGTFARSAGTNDTDDITGLSVE